MTPLLERIDNIDTNLHISAEWAKRKYAEFNSTFFGNSLPFPHVLCYAKYTCCRMGSH